MRTIAVGQGRGKGPTHVLGSSVFSPGVLPVLSQGVVGLCRRPGERTSEQSRSPARTATAPGIGGWPLWDAWTTQRWCGGTFSLSQRSRVSSSRGSSGSMSCAPVSPPGCRSIGGSSCARSPLTVPASHC